ncbi:MAG: NAD(P)-dependent oxidoreductase, partial [Chloroflexi bacterium]|nr:NAD(P)-dependent oxidoreductase [Chloroflexota bacterium]
KYPPGGIEKPITERSLPLDTTAWYGYSKVLGEHLVDRYVRADKVPTTVFRFPYVWGAGEVLNFPQFRLSHFLNEFASRRDREGRATYGRLKALDDGRERLVIACDENGRPYKKHCIEVRDIVHAFDAAAGNARTHGKTFQLAAPSPFSWDEAVPYLAMKLELPYSKVDLAGTNPAFYEFDISAARKAFGYNPQIDIFKMIDEAVRFEHEGGGDLIPTRV